MPDVLRVEIEDADCEEGQVWVFELPIDTPLHKVAEAVQTLYPTATDIHMFVSSKED